MTNQFGELLQDHVHFKWITAPGQPEDYAGQTLLTRDHAVVRAWAQARHAEPATGLGKVNINDGGAAIRFAFPGVGRLQPISWDDWFRDFDGWSLVFAFEERTSEGQQSHKYRLVRLEELRQYAAEAPIPAGDSGTDEPPPGAADATPPAAHGDDPGTPPQHRGWRRAFDFFSPRKG